MPVTMQKSSKGYSVRTPIMVHAKGTTLKKAKAQARLLNAVEQSPMFAKNMRIQHEQQMGGR